MDTLSNQEIFDRAVKQLAGMKERAGVYASGESFHCKYRSPSGPCLAGSFIPDDKYDAAYENLPVGALPSEMLPDVAGSSIRLLGLLQEAHDTETNWSETGFSEWFVIDEIAELYGLKFQSPTTDTPLLSAPHES